MKEYNENDIFYEDTEYSQRADWCNNSGKYHIEEIEPDENGRRFKIVRNPEPTIQQQLWEILDNLANTDYIANKLIEAETEQERAEIRAEYAETLAQRRVWRNRASELKDLLK